MTCQQVEIVREDNTQLASPLMRNATILIVDDEVGMRSFLRKTLEPHCGHVEEAADTDAAAVKLDKTRFDIVILDNLMPGQAGIDWLQQQRKIGFFGEAILITAYADLDTAIAAMRAGAMDFLLKPFRANQIVSAVANCLSRIALRRENTLLRHELSLGTDILRNRNELVGQSEKIERVKSILQQCARLDSSVLITGETGTGKEVAARMLHAASQRADKPFVPITCAALPRDGFNSVLFGSLPQDGAGNQTNDGLFLTAEGGTLFLDDVDELSPVAQALLVQVFETGRLRPISASRDIPINVRIVSSTSKNLLDLVAAGKFREDLYYRLNVLDVDMPSLRERPSDIIDLASMFIDQLSKVVHVAAPEITPAVRRRLLHYSWPGNVRELRNHIERALIHNNLEYGLDFSTNEQNASTLAAAEQRLIIETLEASGGNRAEAARRLGVSRKTIDRKCQAWQL